MKNYERILLIARPDLQRSPAMRQAGRLAQETGAALHMLLPDYSATLDLVSRLRGEDTPALHEAFLRNRRDGLEAQAAELRASGITVTTEAVWTRRPIEEIVLHATEWNADLVVKDVELRSGVRRVLMKSLDWTLLRRCPEPLLLVHSEQLAPRRIIVAVDVMAGAADALNAKIVEHALALAYACQAELHLAYAFQAITPLETVAPMVGPALAGDVYDTLYQLHRESFDAFASAYSVPAERRHFLAGGAAPALFNFAVDSSADVIVMGTTHRSRFERVLLGSTAEAILEHLPCNVLAIKPDGLAAALAEQAHSSMASAS